MRLVRSRKRMLRAAWALAVAAVIVGSLLPGDSKPITALEQLDISDKLEHFAAYALLAFLPAIHERRSLLFALAAVALGVGLEFGQLFSPERTFELGDIDADFLGVCFGMAAGFPLRLPGSLRLAALRIFRFRADPKLPEAAGDAQPL